jgi:hypothetical protein
MSTIKADSVQPTIAGNNLILKSGSGDVERVRISPTGQITFASTTGTTFSGDVNFANATRFPAGIGVGGGFAGTPYTALDVVHTNASLLDPGLNNYNSTRGRSNLSIRGSGTNTTLFLGNAADAAVWLQAQNSDNNQKAISLNPVGGFVGIGKTGPAVALDVVGEARSSTSTTSGSDSTTLTTKDYVDGLVGAYLPLLKTTSGVGRIVAHSVQANGATAKTVNFTVNSGETWVVVWFSTIGGTVYGIPNDANVQVLTITTTTSFSSGVLTSGNAQGFGFGIRVG